MWERAAVIFNGRKKGESEVFSVSRQGAIISSQILGFHVLRLYYRACHSGRRRVSAAEPESHFIPNQMGFRVSAASSGSPLARNYIRGLGLPPLTRLQRYLGLRVVRAGLTIKGRSLRNGILPSAGSCASDSRGLSQY